MKEKDKKPAEQEANKKPPLGQVAVTFLFGDEEAFKKKTAVKGIVPGKGQAMIPTRDVITAAARNLYNIMNGLGQTDIAIHIHDGGPFEIKVEKKMEITVGQLPPIPDGIVEDIEEIKEDDEKRDE